MIVITHSELEEDEISQSYWISSAFASGFLVLFTLTHSIIYIDGVWQTCRQYRNEIIKHTNANSAIVAVVQVNSMLNAQ